MKTFTALARPSPARAAAADELVVRPDGRFQLRSAERGLMSQPNGVYNFVRVQGLTRNQGQMFASSKSGHAALAQGRPVLYAGTICLDGGQLAWWSNYSGTYQPMAAFRGQAKLPEDKFVAWQKLQLGGVGLQRGMLRDRRTTGRPQPNASAGKPAKPAADTPARPAAPSPRERPGAPPLPKS